MNELLNHFSTKLNYEFNDIEAKILSSYFTERKFLKKDFIHREGDVFCNIFIVQGALRIFYLDDNFKEFNLNFGFENDWMSDVDSFINQTPSRLNIQAIENTKVYQINRFNQEKLLDQFPPFNKLFRQLTEQSLSISSQRVLNLISSTSLYRYQSFLDRFKKYENRLPDSYIASYIGVTPEYYSKIKKDYIRSILT